MGNRPMIPKDDIRWREPFDVSPDRIFCMLTILSYLLEQVAPQTGWRKRLFRLLDEHSEIDKRKMGFAKGWEECPFWKPWLEMSID